MSERPIDRAVAPRHALLLLILGSIWGSSYLFIKVLVDVASPTVLIAVRFAFGALVLGLFLALSGRRLPPLSRRWLHLLVMAVMGNVIPFLLIAWGQRHADSAFAAVMNATTPLFTLLIAALVFRTEFFTVPRVTGVAVGFGGVALLTGASILDVGHVDGLSELALLGSSACYGFGYAYARRFVRGDPLQNVTIQITYGLLITTPLALYNGWFEPGNLTVWNGAAWVVLGVAGTGLAYVFLYRLIADIGATGASLVTYVSPLVAVILGWLVLDEYLGLNGLAGMLLIVAGIGISYGWLLRLRRRRARE